MTRLQRSVRLSYKEQALVLLPLWMLIVLIGVALLLFGMGFEAVFG